MRYLFLSFSLLLILSATSCQEKPLSAGEVIDKAIQYHGGQAFDTLDVSFQFRDKTYEIHLKEGNYAYSRLFNDSTANKIVDLLTNEGFLRKINDSSVSLSAKDSSAYANAVNSVQYFALLPYGLQQPAVNSELLPNQNIAEKAYSVVKITFSKAEGGEDYDDEFVYWFDEEDFSMDYLAYSYNTNGGGIRFRKAYNPRTVEGVVFQDYENYKAEKGTALIQIPELYKKGELKLLSKIELTFK